MDEVTGSSPVTPTIFDPARRIALRALLSINKGIAGDWGGMGHGVGRAETAPNSPFGLAKIVTKRARLDRYGQDQEKPKGQRPYQPAPGALTGGLLGGQPPQKPPWPRLNHEG